ncbi:hypothetical protein ACJX0J_009905, partial [Zea mays]
FSDLDAVYYYPHNLSDMIVKVDKILLTTFHMFLVAHAFDIIVIVILAMKQQIFLFFLSPRI